MDPCLRLCLVFCVFLLALLVVQNVVPQKIFQVQEQLSEEYPKLRHPIAVNTSGVLNGKTTTAIAGGIYHSLVLSSTGQVFSFGENYWGQLGDGGGWSQYSPVAVYLAWGVLSGKTIIGIAAGGLHSLVLSSTGQVFSFGFNQNGQLGDGTNEDSTSPVAVSTSGVFKGKTITAISAGGFHSLVLSSTGEVFSFGRNHVGQLGDGSTAVRTTPVAVSTSVVLAGKTITDIAADVSDAWLRKTTERLRLIETVSSGDGTQTSRNVPVAVYTSGVLNGKTITAIAAGGYHSLVLSSTGQVFSFGSNIYGQLGDGTNVDSSIPVAVSTSGVLSGKTITAISAGGYHSLVLSSTGEVFSFGNNINGQLGDSATTHCNIPVAVSTSGVLNGKTITAISAGGFHSLVLSSTGEVFSFGLNDFGQLGDGTTTDRTIPVAVSTSGVLNGKTITAIAAGASHSLVLSSTGEVFSFGDGQAGQLGAHKSWWNFYLLTIFLALGLAVGVEVFVEKSSNKKRVRIH